MEEIVQNIVLRPRFQLSNKNPKELILSEFEKCKDVPFLVKRLDDHVFIKFPKKKNNFWSPQLHLEITKEENNFSRIYGLFGPNPTLWTFFMFIHFAIASIFITLGIWAYSSAALNKTYGLQIGLMCFMVSLWFSLYLFGRYGKRKGKPQMFELHNFMNSILNKTLSENH